MDQPLFGESRPRHRIINIIFGIVTGVFVAVTCVMALLSPKLVPSKCFVLQGPAFRSESYCINPLDIVICAVVILFCVPSAFIAYWYHQGELTPKFKNLLYYNLVITILLCIVANLYFYDTAVWASYRNVSCNKTACTFK